MKKIVIALLLAVVLVLGSLLFKTAMGNIYNGFPMEKENLSKHEVPLYLYIFFSKNSCRDCLEVIGVLNELPAQFKVIGVVPGDELKEEDLIRRLTGSKFPLLGGDNYRKFAPPYSPSIVGLSKKGTINFVLPAVPGEKEYLAKFLTTFYRKVLPSIM